MPAGKFDSELDVDADGNVKAGGPIDMPKDEVVEMCVWVYQRDGQNDAIANMMLPGPEQAQLEAATRGGAAMGGMGAAGDPPKAVTIVKDAAGKYLSLGAPSRRQAGQKGGVQAGIGDCARRFGVFNDQNDHETVFVWSEPVDLNVPTSA